MATNLPKGILSSPRALKYLQTLATLRSLPPAASARLGFTTDMDAVQARQKEMADFLGTPDYDAQNREANDLAKLQLAMSLMGRGFGAMGAAPQRGESPMGALGRTLVAPLASDVSTIAGPLMKQRAATRLAKEQEERQLKLAAYTGQRADAKELRALALKLSPEPKEVELSPKTFFVVTRDGSEKAPWRYVNQQDTNTPIQVRMRKGTGDPYNMQTGSFYPLGKGEVLASADKLKELGLTAPSGTGADAFKDNLVVVSTTTGKPLVDAQSRRVQVSRRGNRLFQLGSDGTPYTQPENTKLVPVSKFDTPDSGTPETDAQRSIQARRASLFSNMNRFQVRRLDGENTPWSAQSALFWDQGSYLKNRSKLLNEDGKNFAFKFIPPGTPPSRAAAEAVTITNPEVIKNVLTTVHALADNNLKGPTFAVETPQIKADKLETAVKSILGQNAQTLFGVSPIEVIGFRNGQAVGYTPGAGAFTPAVQNAAIKTAFTTLKEDSRASPLAAFGRVAPPRSEEGMNRTGGRMVIAIKAFPDAFGTPQVAGSREYDPALDQQRRDVEAVLSKATLPLDASSQAYRDILVTEVNKKVVAREKLQNSVAAADAREMFQQRLDFRRALIAFKNAAAEAGNVQGFIIGPVVAGLATVGLADWIKTGDGAEHWARLTIASDRFQNGQSRRVGREFGDNRISNYDAESYKKLVAGIGKGKKFNKALIEDGLRRSSRELTDLMSLGGKVGWAERELEQAARAGVDFSALKTKENWHGHGYYGKNRYYSTRQQAPSLPPEKRDSLRLEGQIQDTLYGDKYTIPRVDYTTDELPTFQEGRERTRDNPAISATPVLRKGPLQLERYIENQVELARREGRPVSTEIMRERVLRGILRYNIWRDTLSGR